MYTRHPERSEGSQCLYTNECLKMFDYCWGGRDPSTPSLCSAAQDDVVCFCATVFVCCVITVHRHAPPHNPILLLPRCLMVLQLGRDAN